MAKKKAKREKIQSSLLAQLDRKNIRTDYTVEMIEQYMEHYDTVELLTKVIKDEGVQIVELDVKGNEKRKANPAIQTRQNELKAMTTILVTLGLDKPVVDKTAEDDYL